MSEQKYDSILVGWVDEPNYNDAGELLNWRVKLKEHELQDMLEKYLTAKTDKGGGNVYLTLFMSKGGRACCRVYDPNSEGAKEARAKKFEKAGVADDLPF
tara:strand:- start:1132 stop:1431 length:300 start_codon:yes stop_codon:yes gene_type:complete